MNIKLNDTVSISLSKLIESRLLVQANSGGGKSWANRRIIEQAFGHVQIIVLDPEGEFGNMRGEFDFVYIGNGGDAPAESRSAALLARRLLETKASAIIDIYEMNMLERRHFVRLFLEAMVNAPKELWHDCIVILDEAHKFAPEKEQSEALEAVADMASRGRKRGYCLIPATQRPAKLNKDVAAECNNKLIGRASLDIDRKRSAEELGFTSKDEILSLRNLEPGEFYAFGPAIGRDIAKVTIGDVKVKPPIRGQGKKTIPPPTDKVKKLLAQLSDLPQEAQKEAQTISELKAENTRLQRLLKSEQGWNKAGPVPDKSVVDKAVREALQKNIKDWEIIVRDWVRYSKYLEASLNHVVREHSKLDKIRPKLERPHQTDTFVINTVEDAKKVVESIKKHIPESAGPARILVVPPEMVDLLSPIGKGEREILIATAQHPDGITKQHLTVLTGKKRSTRDAYIQRLRNRGFITQEGEKVIATQEGLDHLGPDYKPLPTGAELRIHLLQSLPIGEGKILNYLMAEYPRGIDRDQLSNDLPTESGEPMKRSTRDAYIQRLSARGLVIEESRGVVKAADKLFQ